VAILSLLPCEAECPAKIAHLVAYTGSAIIAVAGYGSWALLGLSAHFGYAHQP